MALEDGVMVNGLEMMALWPNLRYFRYLPGITDGNHEKSQQVSRYPGRFFLHTRGIY
jgi:hypothetical protein